MDSRSSNRHGVVCFQFIILDTLQAIRSPRPFMPFPSKTYRSGTPTVHIEAWVGGWVENWASRPRMVVHLRRLMYSCMHAKTCCDAAVVAKPGWLADGTASLPCLDSYHLSIP